MDLESSLHTRLDSLFKGFLRDISRQYNIDYTDLCNFTNGVNMNTATESKGCMHRMASGKNKGKFCSKKALDNGFCGSHQNRAVQTLAKVAKPKGPTKTQMQLTEWLNTAVPQETTVLKKRSKGLHHEETDIIFDDEYIAIGRLESGKIINLSLFDVEICEKNGWKYDPEAVDNESESE